MKVTIVLNPGDVAITMICNNVQEQEYQTLLSEVVDDPTEDEDYVYCFVYDGGLSEIHFKPFNVEAILASRSDV